MVGGAVAVAVSLPRPNVARVLEIGGQADHAGIQPPPPLLQTFHISVSYRHSFFDLVVNSIHTKQTLFIPSNFRAINLSGPVIFCVGADKRVLPQNKLEKKNPVVSITLKFCVNVAKCLFLMF